MKHESSHPTTPTSPPRAPNDASDAEADRLIAWVEAVQGGEQSAFRPIVQHLQKPLYYTLLRMLRDHDDASDITQRAFVKAYEKLPDLREPAAFKGWLFRIARNLARNLIRDRGRHDHEPIEEADGVSVAPVAEQRISRREQWRRVQGALDVLTPKQRDVLLLRLEGDLSYREIAEAVDSTEGSVRVHYHQAVKRLKAALQEP